MPQSCSSSSLVLNQPRGRSQRHRIFDNSCPPIFARRASHVARVRLTRSHQPLRSSRSTLSLVLDRAQFPIAPAPPIHPTHRGFLPWRFSYAGPRCMANHRHGPASENLHKSGCEQVQQGSRKIDAYLITSSASASSTGKLEEWPVRDSLNENIYGMCARVIPA